LTWGEGGRTPTILWTVTVRPVVVVNAIVHVHVQRKPQRRQLDEPRRVYEDDTQPLAGTKPATYARINQPYFRTSKEYSGRAVAVDTFSKGTTYDGLGLYHKPDLSYGGPVDNSRQVAGYGIRVHHEGYNVLYSDGHSQWFGHPQQKIIRHTEGRNNNGAFGSYGIYPTRLLGNYFFPETFRSYVTTTHQWFAHNALSIWHEFDAAGGKDVDVK